MNSSRQEPPFQNSRVKVASVRINISEGKPRGSLPTLRPWVGQTWMTLRMAWGKGSPKLPVNYRLWPQISWPTWMISMVALDSRMQMQIFSKSWTRIIIAFFTPIVISLGIGINKLEKNAFLSRCTWWWYQVWPQDLLESAKEFCNSSRILFHDLTHLLTDSCFNKTINNQVNSCSLHS